ncbi:hypothetical protein J7K76_06645 [Candidatus Bipolaricaulota bacterium]|nr:hypothetical protein [Candidatus Bipolaricaulota bacterium]
MRKTIFLLVLGTLGLPLAALADTGGSVQATLKLDAVIHLKVTDNWNDLTIVQKGDVDNAIAGWEAGTVIDWDPGTDDIVILLKAITNFRLWACYYAKEGENDVDPPFGDPENLIIISDGTNDYTLTYEEITDPNGYTGSYSGTLTGPLATGTNNIASGGLSKTYNVKLKPENLGDRAAEEEITFTIVFVVEDPTTL